MRTLFFSILLLVAVGAEAQLSINAAGGDITGSGGSIAYSVGQAAYIFNEGSGGTESQGVQQPYEIYVVTGVEIHGVDVSMRASPNPVLDFLSLSISDVQRSSCSYKLHDLGGKLLATKNITENETKIQFGDLAASVYFLSVIQGNTVIKSFKIIKN